VARGDGGSIININSAGSIRPEPQIAAYGGAKAALNAVTTAHAMDLAALQKKGTANLSGR